MSATVSIKAASIPATMLIALTMTATKAKDFAYLEK